MGRMNEKVVIHLKRPFEIKFKSYDILQEKFTKTTIYDNLIFYTEEELKNFLQELHKNE